MLDSRTSRDYIPRLQPCFPEEIWMSTQKIDNQSYYDAFAKRYDHPRDEGYHAFLDRLTVDLIGPRCQSSDVLEVGCGTGLLLERVAPVARRAVGIDISPGMLEGARKRGLEAVQGTAEELPFDDASFDLVYSFKVLAHVEAIEQAMREVSRVLRPGGHAFLEFYNRYSLRYLAKRLAGPGRTSEIATEGDVFTRWDRPRDCRSYLPADLRVLRTHGLRVFTPAAFAHKLPAVGTALRVAERGVRSRTPLRNFGGFFVLEAQRR